MYKKKNFLLWWSSVDVPKEPAYLILLPKLFHSLIWMFKMVTSGWESSKIFILWWSGAMSWICIIIITIELTHSKTIQENTIEIEPKPLALDFKNLSQYSSRSKNSLLNLCCSCCNTNLLQSITKLFGYST